MAPLRVKMDNKTGYALGCGFLVIDIATTVTIYQYRGEAMHILHGQDKNCSGQVSADTTCLYCNVELVSQSIIRGKT